jgi:YYY domain-containing protein
MNSEFSSLVLWYLYFVAIGWASLPLAYTCFRNFPDRGFALAKTQGLFLLSYLVWIATSCGVTRYQRGTIWWMLVGYCFVNFILLMMQFQQIANFIRTQIKLLLLIEGIFLVFFAVGVIIRMYNPDLTGAEKEADFTFLNAILHSKTFPPKDTWFAGTSINYYYFGYLIWATVIKITGIIAPIGFNLALATIVALSATGAFGVVYSLTQRVSYSGLSALFLCIFGNLDGLFQVLQRQGYPLPFDWWKSSRVIPDTINEFPYFSFLLGDLHAHFMAIPFALLLLGLVSQFISGPEEKKGWRSVWFLIGLISLSLGGSAVINGWDYPTYLILAGLCVWAAVWRKPALSGDRETIARRILTVLLMVGFLIVLSRLLFWPFYRSFTAQLTLSNIRLVASAQRTKSGYFLIIYGLFLWISGFFVYTRFQRFFTSSTKPENTIKLIWWNSLLLIAVLIYLLSYTWVLSLSCLLCGVFLYLWYQEAVKTTFQASNDLKPIAYDLQPPIRYPEFKVPKPQPPTLNPQLVTRNSQLVTRNPQLGVFPYLLLFLAFAITAGCELIYIKDFYGHPLERQNTIFKFYYQAWILLSIGTPYLLFLIGREKWEIPPTIKQYGTFVLILLCCACCIYPVFATYEKTNRFRSGSRGGVLYIPTLNGISYIAYNQPYEYDALMWIQNNTAEDDVVLEATGKPYSFFGRVATTTGRSTILGWGNHESLWRDQTWKSITQRTEEIKQIYEARDKASIMRLLQIYQVKYIYVGTLERETYNLEGLAAFKAYFPQVFENSSVRIYSIPKL